MPTIPSEVAIVANDSADVDDAKQPVVKPSGGHRHSHIFAKGNVVTVRVCAKCKVEQALKLDERHGLSSLAQFCMGKVEEVCEIGGMGEEEATLETVEARDETLVAQQELKKRAVCMRIVVFDELVKTFGLSMSVQHPPESKQDTDRSSSMARSSSRKLVTLCTSIPHSRITFRYLPASKTLCFQFSSNGGIHAPPGKCPLPALGGGTPAWCRLFREPSVEPSRSWWRLESKSGIVNASEQLTVYRRSQYSSV